MSDPIRWPDQSRFQLERAVDDAVHRERRYVYEYLKAQAEEVHTRSVLREWSRTQVGNNLVRLAGEILRGLHVDPVKINNPELWT